MHRSVKQDGRKIASILEPNKTFISMKFPHFS